MTLRFATFNLLDLFEPDTDAARAIWPQKLDHIAAQLERADADVVALQELGSEALLHSLCDGRLARLGYAHRLVGTGDRRGIRNAIVARRPFVEARIHQAESLPFPRFVEGDPEPFPGRIPLRRGLLHARVEAGALRTVDVLTVHFKSKLGATLKAKDGTDLVDRSARGRAEAQLRSLVLRSAEALFVRGVVDDVLAEPGRNAVVLGDFNDTLDSLPIAIVRGAHRHVDPALVLEPATRLVPEERRFSALHGGIPQQIDHVLVSQRLSERLVEARIQNEALRDLGPYRPDAPPAPDSDHALVVATVDDGAS
jgi:endonuclease/exonuclease/phosphatase family metal-dependent hydrolase